jgi:hypothetical protein
MRRNFIPIFSLQFTDYHVVAEGYGGRGLTLNEQHSADIASVLQKAQALSRDGHAVLINALIGKTDFRKGSISV